jgi:hypothetical protein
MLSFTVKRLKVYHIEIIKGYTNIEGIFEFSYISLMYTLVTVPI